jgi:hypothetical protein
VSTITTNLQHDCTALLLLLLLLLLLAVAAVTSHRHR